MELNIKTQLYILGFLLQEGPLHGYALKKIIEERVSDFTCIKVPVIYYHLEKMEDGGFVKGSQVKEGKRPDRRVYIITENGKVKFKELLEKALTSMYRAEFLFDAIFIFFNQINKDKLIKALKNQEAYLHAVLQHIDNHKEEMVKNIPKFFFDVVNAIFSHHRVHYEAEYNWLQEIKKTFYK